MPFDFGKMVEFYEITHVLSYRGYDPLTEAGEGRLTFKKFQSQRVTFQRLFF